MIRFLFRFIGLLSLALAFIFLVYDGTKSIADQRLYVTKVAEVWATLHEASLAAGAARRSKGWRPGSGTRWPSSVLDAPAWLVLVILGTILVLLGRKRRPLIGYARN